MRLTHRWQQTHHQWIKRMHHILYLMLLHCELQVHTDIIRKGKLTIKTEKSYLKHRDILLFAATRPILDTISIIIRATKLVLYNKLLSRIIGSD